MEKIIINQKLTDSEIKKYCENNNKTLIFAEFKENTTVLNVI